LPMGRALYMGGTQSHLVSINSDTWAWLLNGYPDSTVLAERFRISYIYCCYACSLGGYISHVQCADDLLFSGSSPPGEPTLASKTQSLLDHMRGLGQIARTKQDRKRSRTSTRKIIGVESG